MFIVDSQVHIWKEETPDRPWIKGARERMVLNGHRLEPFSYQECIKLMDEAGVNRALILPPSWEGDRIDYALEACEACPDRFGVMARIPLKKPNEAKAMLRDWKQIPDIKGIRLTFHRPQDRNWMIDGTADWYWPFAEETRHQDHGACPDLESRAGRHRPEAPEAAHHHRSHGDHGPMRRRCHRLLGAGDSRSARAPEYLRQGFGAARIFNTALPVRQYHQVCARDGR